MASKGDIPPPNSSVKTARRRRPRKQGDDENRPTNEAFPLEDWKNDNKDDNDKDFLDLSRKIRNAEQVVRSVVWKSNDALRTAVIRSSLDLAGFKDGSNSLLLLNEHESKFLNFSRTCVREATESKDEKEQYPRLLLSTHTIRALVRFVTKLVTQEAMLQILYHIINALGNSEFYNDGYLILLAFEALYQLLMRFKKEMSGKRISFDTVAREKVFVFPIPIHKKGSSSKDDAGLSIDKICTIAIHAIVYVSKSILSRHSAENYALSLPDYLRRLHQTPLAVARHLLSEVATFWVHTQAKISKKLKEGLSHCKRIHRLLWEHAASSVCIPAECLQLRQDSLLVLLTGESSSLCQALESKFGDTVCTYACKTSATFLSQSPTDPVSDKSNMICFHQMIGPQLDRVFEHRMGLPYLEYCAIRAQHVGVSPPPEKSCLEPEFRPMYAVLRLSLLTVELNRTLAGTDEMHGKHIEQASETIDEFRSVFFDDSSFDLCWSAEDISRINKIVGINPLHNLLYNSLKDGTSRLTDEAGLRLGAKIMTQCFGPFLLLMASKLEGERFTLCEKAIDCFSRGVTVFESEICQSSEKVEAALVSKDLFVLASDLHIISKDTSSHFERFAKCLSSSARKREEKGSFKAALMLQIVSLRLFTEISLLAERNLDNLMLSQRWACLSSFFGSNEHPDASVVAGLLSLLYDAAEKYEEGEQRDMLDVDLFGFICARSNGMLDLSQCGLLGSFDISDRRRVMVLRIFRILSETKTACPFPSKKRDLSVLDFSSVFCCFERIANGESSTIVADYFMETCNVPFSLSGLLRVMLPMRGPFSVKSDSVVVVKLKLLLDIVYECGTALNSGTLPKGGDYHNVVHSLNQISHIAGSLLEKLQDESMNVVSRAALRTSIYCAAASSIAPVPLSISAKTNKRNIVDSDPNEDEFQKRVISSGLVNSAIACLSECSSSDSQIASKALEPILLHMKREYGELSDPHDLAKSMQVAMETFDVLKKSDTISLRVLGAHILVSFFSTQSEFCHARGEGFKALRLAEWSFRVANALDREDRRWLEVAYLRKMSPCTFLSPVGPSEWTIDSLESASIDAIEVQANRIRCQLVFNNESSAAAQVCSLLGSRLDECRSLFHEQPGNLFLQARWLQGTLTQALAQSYAARGDLERAIFFCKDCLRLCKQAIIASTRQLSSFSRIRWSTLFDLTILQRLEDRQIDLLHSLASLYQAAGDYRRAETYLYSTVKCLDSDDLATVIESIESVPRLIELLYSLRLDNPRLTGYRRLIWEFAAARSPWDQLTISVHSFREKVGDVPSMTVSKDDSDLDLVLEGIARLRLQDIVGETNKHSPLWEEVRGTLEAIRTAPELSGLAKLVAGAISPLPQSDLDIYEARQVVRDIDCKDEFRQEIALRRSCKRILESRCVTSSQRSDALYILGLLYLREAREEGALTRLWHGHSNQEGTRLQFESDYDSALADAKRCFAEALSLRAPSSDRMTRNILRSLALVSGPDDDSKKKMASWEMIHSSIGSSVRQRLLQALNSDKSEEKTSQPGDDVFAVLRCLDLPFFSRERKNAVACLVETLETYLLCPWRTVAIALCPTGELLINLVEVGDSFASRTVCIFPSDSSDVYDTMMQPLDELITQSQGQLRQESKPPSSVEEGDSDRREWWSHRDRIDNELNLLSRAVEQNFFGSPNVQAVLCGDSEACQDNSTMEDWANQKSYAMSLFEGESPQKDGPDPSTLKVTELREELIEMGIPMKDLRKMQRSELIDLLTEERRRRQSRLENETHLRQEQSVLNTPSNQQASTTMLVLDEDLHRFPLESLPCLRGKVVCRTPSISFLAVKLIELHRNGRSSRTTVDPGRSSFILDPESNLTATRERIGEFLESHRTKHNYDWESVIGEAPMNDFFRNNLVRENAMFLFFGHGGGQAYFSRSAVESLISAGERQVKASVILMGCSSGRLASVNRKNLESPRKIPILFEPEGLALSYLAAGAPCVIGNLWDVTDRDIDRFSVDMLSKFYGGQDLASSLAQARSVCKMKFLNGYAPVYYGIPVFPKELAKCEESK